MEKKFIGISGFLIITFIIFTFSLAQALPIEVYFDPLDQNVFLNETFDVRLAADISALTPVFQFGLDLQFIVCRTNKDFTILAIGLLCMVVPKTVITHDQLVTMWAVDEFL